MKSKQETKKAFLGVKIPHALQDALRHQANKEDRSVSYVVNRILRDALVKKKGFGIQRLTKAEKTQ